VGVTNRRFSSSSSQLFPFLHCGWTEVDRYDEAGFEEIEGGV
jgi:hypothetical protein